MKNGMLFSHPMNQLMQAGTPLPQYDSKELAMKYIMIAKSGQLPTTEQVEAVRTGILDYSRSVHGDNVAFYEADVHGMAESWPMMSQLLAKSMGLTQMMLDYGTKSRFFYQYVYEAHQKKYAVALEAKDGRAISIANNATFEQIPQDDWATIVGVEDPNHSARRGTDAVGQTLLRNAKAIFEGGAGLMPAYRNYDYPLGQNNQRIVACDSDERLPAYLRKLLPDPMALGINYQVGNLLEVMDRPEYYGQFDVVRMTGLLSYFTKFEDKLEIMRKAKRLLKKDGVILTDLWVMGPAVIRSGLIGIWPNDPSDPYRLTPSADIATAVGEMETICTDIDLPFVHISDIVNGNPLCWTQITAVPKCEIFLIGNDVSLDMLDIPA